MNKFNKNGFISIELVIIAGVAILFGTALVLAFMWDSEAISYESVDKIDQAVGVN